MFDLLWRMLRKNNVGPSGAVRLPAERHLAARPQLEALEDRMMPSQLLGVAPPAVPSTPPAGIAASTSSNNLQTLTNPPARSTQYMVVLENSPQSIINLDQVFAAQSGLQQEDGLQWSMLGNTNAALVKTNLSEAELTLTYTPGQWGGAAVTVGATDADGVSEQESILVLVEPWKMMGPAWTA